MNCLTFKNYVESQRESASRRRFDRSETRRAWRIQLNGQPDMDVLCGISISSQIPTRWTAALHLNSSLVSEVECTSGPECRPVEFFEKGCDLYMPLFRYPQLPVFVVLRPATPTHADASVVVEYLTLSDRKKSSLSRRTLLLRFQPKHAIGVSCIRFDE